MITTLIAEQFFDGIVMHYNQAISFENDKIIALDTVKNAREIPVFGLLVPGFIDIQVNGGGGKLFNDSPTLETLEAMVSAHAKFGTTAMSPTLITDNLPIIEQAANTVSLAMTKKMPGIIGIHFEGPHISVAKKGIHHGDKIRGITAQELAIYCRADLGQKIITIAPETVEPAIIKVLVEHGVHVCLGHSNANYEQTSAALDAGATGFTHLFNAMSPLGSREPNMVGAALEDKLSWCGLILDGHHVSPITARIAYQAKAKHKMMLVTDAMSTIGSEQSSFVFDGHQIHLTGDKLVSNTGKLAGAAIDMITAVNNAVSMLDIPLSEALNMASLYPANFLGIGESRGQLSVGSQADLTLLSTEKSARHSVLSTWVAGTRLY